MDCDDCASFLIVLDPTKRNTGLSQVWAFEREFSEILRGKGWDPWVEGRMWQVTQSCCGFCKIPKNTVI